VKLIIGGKEFKTGNPRSATKNYNRFNHRFEQTPINAPYVDISDFGNVILLLMDGDTPVCYYKESIENFTNPNAEYKWCSLLPDKVVGKVKNPNEAGMISFKLSIHDVTKNGPIKFSSFEAWS